jgi:hypothetical protein
LLGSQSSRRTQLGRLLPGAAGRGGGIPIAGEMETSPPHWPAAVAFSAPCPVAPNAGYFTAASPSRAASLTRRPSARRRPCRIVRARAHSPRPLLAQRQAPRFAQELFFALRNPYTAGFALTAACAAFGIGWLLSSRVSRVHVRRLELAAANSATRPMAVARDGDDDDDAEENTGDNALWLNLSLFPSAWRLFRKNTATLISQTLQPILDKVELPDFIKRVEIRALTIGSRPPLVRKIRRLPSRARSELQYRCGGRAERGATCGHCFRLSPQPSDDAPLPPTPHGREASWADSSVT